MTKKRTTRKQTARKMNSQRPKRSAMEYRSPIHAAIHEGIEDLYKVGIIDKHTMRRFDDSCLTPVRDLTPDEIRTIRLREGASQAVFARYLNVTPNLISQWERGEKHPQGPSLKMLTLVGKKGLESVA
jgi:putative transcriptional regulator